MPYSTLFGAAAAAPACSLRECARCPGTCQPGQRMGRVLQRMAKVIQLRARVPFVRTIGREGGSVFALVRQRLLPLRVCPVSRNLSGSSEDGESPSEVGQSHSAESKGPLLFPVVRHLQQQVQQQQLREEKKRK